METMSARRELVVERVLRCVEQVPAGRVAAYGVIGRIVGVGPRQVGSIMRHWGSNVAWWRVTNAAGDLPGLMDAAHPLWEVEGIEVKEDGRGCRYAVYGADETVLREAWLMAVADLPTLTSTDAETE